MSESPLNVVARGRQAGKTTDALRWLADGERCPGYPGWTRVLVVTDPQRFLVVKRMAQSSGLFDAPRLEGMPPAHLDLDHRIYFLSDWQQGRVSCSPEVWLDDAEWHLHNLLRGNGRLTTVSMTATVMSDP